MHKPTNRVAKGLAVAALCLAYQAPGCSFNFDEAAFQSLLGSLGNFSELKFELELDGDGDNHSQEPSDDEPDFDDDD